MAEKTKSTKKKTAEDTQPKKRGGEEPKPKKKAAAADDADAAKPKKKRSAAEDAEAEEAPKSSYARSPYEDIPDPVFPPDNSYLRGSVMLFSTGLIIFLMSVIPGSSGWRMMHDFMFGIFGFAAYLVPLVLMGFALYIGSKKEEAEMAGRLIHYSLILVLLLCGGIQIYLNGDIPGSGLKCVPELFKEGKNFKGGGVFALPIGGLLIKALGRTGARITFFILSIAIGLLMTNTDVLDFFKFIAKPFRFMGRCLFGIHCMIMGGDFSDAFDDEDEDENAEDAERKSFDEDLEAIELANNRNRQAAHNYDDVSESPVKQKTELRGVPDENGFVMDIPLPDEQQFFTQKPEEQLDIPDFAPVSKPKPEPDKKGSVIDDDIPLIPELEAERERRKKENAKKQAEQPQNNCDDDELERLINKAAAEKAKSDAASAGQPVEEKPKELTPIYILPGLDLLTPPDVRSNSAEAAAEMREKADTIVSTFKSFNIEVKIRNIYRGPAITRYEIQPGTGVRVNKIRGLEDDIALSLAAQGVRIEAPVPGKAAVGIEVPNINKDTVTLREILSSSEFRNSKSKLAFAVGKDITGNAIVGDIAKMPHVIIAGTTGSGKSVCTRSIIMSILYNAKPDEVKVILIDPKIVEFKVFDGIPHLLTPIITDAKKAPGALNWAVLEMMRRYQIFADNGANDLRSFNDLAEMDDELEPMPQIVIFIDELADMMLVAGKEVEDSICRLAQMGRAAGMHLVIATQRPTTDVITGLIKANIPSRIALSVMSQVDSRTIIDMGGADKLLGNGDMLYMPIGIGKPVRVQGCFASQSDIEATLSFIKSQGEVRYDDGITNAVESYTPQNKNDHGGADSGEPVTDEDYIVKAAEVAVGNGQLSTTMLQKKLKLGYARASRIMDELEERGIIGPSEGSKPRKVYMSKMQFDEWKMRQLEDDSDE